MSPIVSIKYVDLTGIMSGVKHSYTEGDTLVKYSKKEHSPVSSCRSNELHLGTKDSYKKDENENGLVGDDLEGVMRETFNSKTRGSRFTETFKDLTKSFPFPIYNLKGRVDFILQGDYYLYCTSIDPEQNRKRKKQMVKTDPEYDYMTKIVNPTVFAEKLGSNIAEETNSNYVEVCYGPVIYLDQDKKQKVFLDTEGK